MNTLVDKINTFVLEHLPEKLNSNSKSKYLHDPIWGTIELFPFELCIIDTPLFQRLRFIHQTGFVFQTYPSATHTRFEHTLGTVHLAHRIITTLEAKFTKWVEREAFTRVRLAALFHDIGHSAYSHSSEEIYQNMPDMLDLLKTEEKFRNKGAGEVLSYLILTSDAMHDYFKKLKTKYNHALDKIEIKDFASYILGKAENDRLFEANIISGPFDADKLDYFPRDGRASGIEISLDIERLIHCLEIAEVEKKVSKNKTEIAKTLVMNRGGFNAAQQLLFARASLFATVYHHQKVRSCDCMFKAGINLIRDGKIELRIKTNQTISKLESTADYLYIHDLDFYATIHYNTRPQISYIKDIYERNLLKRALTISSYTVYNLKNSKEQSANFGEFLNFRKKTSLLKNLIKTIHKESKAECHLNQVWLDIPKKPTFSKAGQALINMAARNREPEIAQLAEVIPIHDWIETYELFYSQSFIFGPQNKKDRIAIAIAAIKTLSSFSDEQGLTILELKLNENAVAEDIREEVKEVLGDELPPPNKIKKAQIS